MKSTLGCEIRQRATRGIPLSCGEKKERILFPWPPLHDADRSLFSTSRTYLFPRQVACCLFDEGRALVRLSTLASLISPRV